MPAAQTWQLQLFFLGHKATCPRLVKLPTTSMPNNLAGCRDGRSSRWTDGSENYYISFNLHAYAQA